MERTESKIVQVSPEYENMKIQELQTFSWNLQGRQEVHEEGDTEGGPDLIGDGYTTKTKVNVYVKLHFVRSMESPNIGRVKELEAEYNSLERPNFPALVPGGFPLIIIWLLPWLTIYLPFFYFRKKQIADQQSQLIRAKYDEVSQKLVALEVGAG
jgi:hypothetical protein